MLNQSRILLNYGKYHRIWPFADIGRKKLYVTVALLRPSSTPICKLIQSEDYGESWDEMGDFVSIDKRNTTTGQPFVTKDRTVLVATWNAGFYTHGTQWLAIYASNDSGQSWREVYQNQESTYGKHFFQGPDGDLYIGVGVGGGGSKGIVSSTPWGSYLLKSTDEGETWSKILSVDYPTSLYSGVALDDKTIIVAARERKSLFLSSDDGKTWKALDLGSTTRCVSYIKELDKIVVTSDSALLVSCDADNWTRLNAPIKGMILRYPVWREEKLYMSSVGWHSYIVSTDLNKWHLSLDVTAASRSNLGARMTILDDYAFVGDEANGTLIRTRLPHDSDVSINRRQVLRGNVKHLFVMANHALRRIRRYV